MRTVLAGDLGGTKCRFALVSEDYGVHCVQRVATVREQKPFLAAMDEAIEQVLAERATIAGLEAPLAMGFGTAGVIPPGGGAITYAPNLPLDGFPLTDHVQQRFGMPVSLLNDGRASAWGEFLRGHAAHQDPLLCLFFGTGVGIGLIVDGKPYGGGNNAAGEIGHTVFRPGGRRCPCGRVGHFESYCGGRAITERALEELGAPPDGHGTRGQWTVGDVVAAAEADGPLADGARLILAEAEEAACTMVANCCVLLNPRAVVLGGGMLSGWPQLRERIVQHVERTTSEAIRKDLQFVPSLGGSDAILWGAAASTGALWA
ncbi:MAG: ROK family protein [Planctomycetes bacterium]|nr:ROK family protein [Planctomycetota bacterium]